MASSVDNESEILLGNKQLLAVFAVVAFLLAIAFTGGYMLGKSSAEKKASAVEAGSDPGTALVPRTVTPDDSATKTDTTSARVVEPPASETRQTPTPPATEGNQDTPASPVVKRHPPDETTTPPLGSRPPDAFPKPGQTFVQVAALSRTEAAATAEVLRKQNFQARIAPAPGNTVVYRVLVGPTKDAAEITATRDALRKIGFRDVIVRHY